jgi:hypothetical protein
MSAPVIKRVVGLTRTVTFTVASISHWTTPPPPAELMPPLAAGERRVFERGFPLPIFLILLLGCLSEK